MKNNYISKLHFISKHLFTLLVLGFLFIGVGSVSGATYYSAGNNNPNTLANWWININGTGAHPANFSTAGNIFVIQSGHTMTTTATWTVSGAGSTIQINTGGTLVASNTVTTTVMTVASGGTYQHNIDGGTIPAATWNAGSLLKITGITNTIVTLPTTIGGNVEWNCPNQTVSNEILTHSSHNIGGNFSLSNTGTGAVFLWDQTGAGYTLSIGGNFSQLGGSLIVDKKGDKDTHTINVNGNWSMTGGTFDCSGNTDNKVNIGIN
jgi:outer membrane biogenesis lipoprotein LolB